MKHQPCNAGLLNIKLLSNLWFSCLNIHLDLTSITDKLNIKLETKNQNPNVIFLYYLPVITSRWHTAAICWDI